MIYTGFLGGATDVVTAFSGCDAETSLIFATTDHDFVYADFVSADGRLLHLRDLWTVLWKVSRLMIPAIGNPDFCMVS